MDNPISIDFLILSPLYYIAYFLHPDFHTDETTDTFYARLHVEWLHKNETSVFEYRYYWQLQILSVTGIDRFETAEFML